MAMSEASAFWAQKSPKQCSIEVQRFNSARNRTWAACFKRRDVNHRTIRTHVLKSTSVPIVYMVWDIVILRRANPLLEPYEGVGPESLNFQGPPLQMILKNGFARLKITMLRTI